MITSETRPGEQKRLTHPCLSGYVASLEQYKGRERAYGLSTKQRCKGSCCTNFIIVLKENILIFIAAFSRGWCISSSLLRTFI